MPQIYENVTALVQEKFSASMEFASEAYAETQGLIDGLASVVVAPAFSDEVLTVPSIVASLPIDTDIPEQPTIDYPDAELPEGIEINAVEVSDTEFPEFGLVAPVITLPEEPDLDEYDLPSGLPSITQVDLPGDISLDDMNAPTLSTISIPSAPSLQIPAVPNPNVPVFDADYDAMDFDVSSVFSEVALAIQYLKSELTGTAATLLDYIQNPQMAIGDTLTTLMIARDKEKLADEYEARQTEILNFWEARGWDTPQGVMAARLNENDRLRYLSEDNIMRDYTIKDWELSQQNMQNAIQVLPGYTNTLVNLTDSILGKTLEMAKYAFEAAYNKYRAATEIYKQDIEVYKTAYMVYEIQVNAQKLLVELFQAQVSAAKLQAEIDAIQAEIYKTFIAMQSVRVDFYKAKVQGALAKMDFSKASIDLYRAQIEGFVAGMGANNAKIQLYQGQIAGEEAKLRLFNTQVAGYSALTDNAKAQASVKTEEAKLSIENSKLLLANYEAALKGYAIQLEDVAKRNDIEAKVFMGKIGIFEAVSKAAVAKSEVLIKEAEVNARMAEQTVETRVRQAEMNMHNANIAAQITTEAMKSAAAVSAQITASALSAVSAGAHLQASSSLIENV